jgi:predicted metal-binding transcription factor (methanogenesis marker protein 9)
MIIEDFPRETHTFETLKKKGDEAPKAKEWFKAFPGACRYVPLKVVDSRINNGKPDTTFRITDYFAYKHKYEVIGSTLPHRTEEQNRMYHFNKMHFLIHNIKNNGLEYPPQGVLTFDNFPNQKLAFSYHVHPGTGRVNALRWLDWNPNVIVWDPYELFRDYPALDFEMYCDIFWQNHVHKEGEFQLNFCVNGAGWGNLECFQTINYQVNYDDHYAKIKHMFKKKPTLYIGYDSRHGSASKACERSINKWTHPFIIKYLDVSQIPEYTREYANQSTEFTYSRFLIPHLENYEGISLFCDDDFIFLQDPTPLIMSVNHDEAVSCVKHDFSDKGYRQKLGNEKDVWYPKKLWSSLMVFNNAHEDCKKLTPEVINSESGQYLHQFQWTNANKIGAIPDRWNWCEGYSDDAEFYKAGAVHFTRGGPWIKDMDCKHIKYTRIHEIFRIDETRMERGMFHQ